MIRTTLIALSALSATALPVFEPGTGVAGLRAARSPEPQTLGLLVGADQDEARTDDGTVARADLGFATFDVRGMNMKQVQGLLRLATDLVGGTVFLEDGRSQLRFQAVGNQVFVIDDAAGRERALEMLRTLAASIGSSGDEAPIPEPETRLWSPVHLSEQSAIEAVGYVLGGDYLTLGDTGALLLRAEPEALDAAWPLLEELDAPRTPLTLELLVLGRVAAADQELETPPLPQELRSGLATLLPDQNFALLAGATLRTSSGHRGLRLLSSIGDVAEIGLDVGQVVHDPRNGLAALHDCRLALTPLSPDSYTPVDVATSLDLDLGEYVVLTSVGRRDLFFVLRVVAS